MRQIDFPHSARANQGKDLVMGDTLPHHQFSMIFFCPTTQLQVHKLVSHEAARLLV